MTPELRPVWWVATAGSFSRTVTSSPRRVSARAVASPTIPPPTITTLIGTPGHPSSGQREARGWGGSAVRTEPQQQLRDEDRGRRAGRELAEQHRSEEPRP